MISEKNKYMKEASRTIFQLSAEIQALQNQINKLKSRINDTANSR